MNSIDDRDCCVNCICYKKLLSFNYLSINERIETIKLPGYICIHIEENDPIVPYVLGKNPEL